MIRKLATILLLVAATCFAAAPKPSESSIRELLEITKAKKLVDSMVIQMDTVMKNALAQAARGQQPSLELNAIADRMQKKLMDLLKEELDWSVLEPIYVTVYREHFSQQEVDGMLAFYRTPVGISVVDKLPLVVEQSMLAMQTRMGPMLKKLELIQAEVVREVQQLAEKNG
jgi:hypothetical protein